MNSDQLTSIPWDGNYSLLWKPLDNPGENSRPPDGYVEFCSAGSLLSGRAESTTAEPDDFLLQYVMVGPAVARLIVSRGSQAPLPSI